MPTIKVVDGDGFVTINGAKWPKGSFPVIPLGNGEIQLGVRENTIAKGLFSDYLDGADDPFVSEAAALTFLDVCFVPDAV